MFVYTICQTDYARGKFRFVYAEWAKDASIVTASERDVLSN